MKEICQEYKKHIKELFNNKTYVVTIILVAILSYGFTITNFAIGVDDLGFDRYVTGTYILSAGRWGVTLLYSLLQIFEFTPFWLELVVTIFIVFMAIIFTTFLKKSMQGKLNTWHYIIVSSMLISYPMISQAFIYQSTNLAVVVSNLAFIIIPILIYEMYKKHINSRAYLLIGLIIPIFISMYESCCQTYLCMAGIISFLEIWNNKNMNKKEMKKSFKYFIICILVLAIGIMFNKIIVTALKIFLNKNDLLQLDYSSKFVPWGRISITEAIEQFKQCIINKFIVDIKNTSYIRNFFLLGLITLGITIYKAIKEKKYSLIFYIIVIIGSNFFICLIQDRVLYRVNTSWSIAIAFFAFYILASTNKEKVNKLLCFIFTAIIIIQSKTINQCFYNDYVRYTREADYINSIAIRIIEECEDTTKPIVYLYEPHEGIHQKRINSDNGWSVIDWGTWAFDEPGSEITKFMNSLGYNFTISTNEQTTEVFKNIEKLEKEDNKIKKIQETEKYIVVIIDCNI